MHHLSAGTLCRSIHRACLAVLLVGIAVQAKPLLAQAPATAPANYEPCADASSGIQPVVPQFQVESTLNALYKPAEGSTSMLSVHRGFWQNAPENSMSAIYDAVRHKFPISEVDLYQTQDGSSSKGQVVLSHDNDVARTTTGTGLITNMSASTYTKLFLRDRHGCPTGENPVTLATALNDMFVTDQVYIEDEDPNHLTGEVLVLDIKSSTASAMYLALLEAISEWEDNGIVGYGPVQSIIFKVPMYFGGKPVMPTPTDCDSQNNCGYNKFIADIRKYIGGTGPLLTPNMIYVLYAPDSVSYSDTYFVNYDRAWTYGGGGTLGFETHERYPNDQLTSMRQYLQAEGRAVGSFAADDMFPEGEPYLNLCCRYFNLNLLSPPEGPPSAPGCLTQGFQVCFDERVRWDFQFQSVGVGLLTLERPVDAQSYLGGLQSSEEPTLAAPQD